MNNDEIIANVAISKGLLTPDEINELLEAGKEIPEGKERDPCQICG